MSALLKRIQGFAISQPNDVALSSDDSQIDYLMLQSKIEQLSAIFMGLKCRTLGILLDNAANWVVIQLAAMHGGIAVIPIPTFFSDSQREHLISNTDIDLILAPFDYGVLNPSYRRVKLNKALIPESIYACLRFSVVDNDSVAPAHAQSIIPPNTALITFTSGTTGDPKGVCISTLLIDQMCESLHGLTDSLGIKKHLSLLPLSVMLENIAGVFLPLYAGKTVVVDTTKCTGLMGSSGIDMQQLSNYLATHDVDSLILTPELLKILVLLKQQGLPLESLKYVAVGGGKVSPALLQYAHSVEIPVYEGYGLSECGSVVALNTPNAYKLGSVGKPLSHCHIEIRKAGEISEAGEIIVSGPKTLGYLHSDFSNVPEVNAIATGDLGYLDEEGFLFITGRSKNVQINSYGRNFSPEWVESEINRLPGVIRSAIFGDDKPFITAVVQMLPKVTEAQLWESLELLNQTLPDYAQIRHLVTLNDGDIAKAGLLTGNGRIRRDKIQQFYSSKIEAGYIAEASTL